MLWPSDPPFPSLECPESPQPHLLLISPPPAVLLSSSLTLYCNCHISHQPSAKYTGEAFGILYLYRQSGWSLICKDEDLDQLIDEGSEDFTEEDNSTATDPSGVDTHTLVPPFSDSENNGEEEVWKHSFACA